MPRNSTQYQSQKDCIHLSFDTCLQHFLSIDYECFSSHRLSILINRGNVVIVDEQETGLATYSNISETSVRLQLTPPLYQFDEAPRGGLQWRLFLEAFISLQQHQLSDLRADPYQSVFCRSKWHSASIGTYKPIESTKVKYSYFPLQLVLVHIQIESDILFYLIYRNSMNLPPDFRLSFELL